MNPTTADANARNRNQNLARLVANSGTQSTDLVTALNAIAAAITARASA